MQIAAGQTVAGTLIEFVIFPLVVLAVPAIWVAAFKFSRSWGQLARDLRGEPARPGVAARLGVMERLQGMDAQMVEMREQVGHIHYETKPNGGWSMKDQVNRMDPLYRAPTAPLEDPAAAS